MEINTDKILSEDETLPHGAELAAKIEELRKWLAEYDKLPKSGGTDGAEPCHAEESHTPGIGEFDTRYLKRGDREIIVANDGERVYRIDLKRSKGQTVGRFFVDDQEKYSVTTTNFMLARKLCISGSKVYFTFCAKRNRNRKMWLIRRRAAARAAFGTLGGTNGAASAGMEPRHPEEN